jgi:hypothetical protein
MPDDVEDQRPTDTEAPDRVASVNQPGREPTTGNAGLQSGLDVNAPGGAGEPTAGARAADRLPDEAVRTPASELRPEQGGDNQG